MTGLDFVDVQPADGIASKQTGRVPLFAVGHAAGQAGLIDCVSNTNHSTSNGRTIHMTRVIAFAVAALLAGRLHAEIVKGKIVDEHGAGIPEARVRIKGTKRQTIAPAGRNGTFRVEIALGEPSVRVEVNAPGYITRKRILLFRDGVADAGNIRMDTEATLSAETFVVSRSADGKLNHLDIFIRNDRPRSIDVVSVDVTGAQNRSTSCGDVSPGLTLKVADTIVADGVGVAVIETGKSAADSVIATGAVRHFACQQQLELTIKYPFRLNAGEHTKLRVAIPTRMSLANNKSVAVLQLDTYEVLVLTFRMSDGTEVTAEPWKKR